MPNLPQSLTTQEPASLTGEGLPLDSEAPLRECSESLQAKYLINDSQQTHIKSTHTHHRHPPLVHNETELNAPLQQFLRQGPELKTQVHHAPITRGPTQACRRTYTLSQSGAAAT